MPERSKKIEKTEVEEKIEGVEDIGSIFIVDISLPILEAKSTISTQILSYAIQGRATEDKRVPVRKYDIIIAAFTYLKENDSSNNILECVQEVLEHCNFRKLSARNIVEASLMYAFSLGLNQDEWNEEFISCKISISKSDCAFESRSTTYGDLKNAVIAMSDDEDRKTSNFTVSCLLPKLKAAIKQKDFSLFYDDETVKKEVVSNYKKTIYYINKFLLDMIEEEIEVYLRYINKYPIIGEHKKKNGEGKEYSDSEIAREHLRFLAKRAVTLKGLNSYTKDGNTIEFFDKYARAENTDPICNLEMKDFEPLAINYKRIVQELNNYVGLDLISHSFYRVLLDMNSDLNYLTVEERGDEVVLKLEGDNYALNSENFAPVNALKYYIWWQRKRGNICRLDEYKEQYKDNQEEAQNNAIKGYRARLRKLYKSINKEYNYELDNECSEFTESEFEDFTRELKAYLIKRDKRACTIERKLSNILEGKKEISRYYFLLFGVFSGHSSKYLSHCCKKCGFHKINVDYTGFDLLIEKCALLDGHLVDEYNKETEEKAENIIDYRVLMLRDEYNDGFSFFIDYYTRANDMFEHYESDVAAINAEYGRSSLYAILSNEKNPEEEFLHGKNENFLNVGGNTLNIIILREGNMTDVVEKFSLSVQCLEKAFELIKETQKERELKKLIEYIFERLTSAYNVVGFSDECEQEESRKRCKRLADEAIEVFNHTCPFEKSPYRQGELFNKG